MRRIASVFSKRDKDKKGPSENALRPTLSLGKLSTPKLSTPSIPVLVQSQDSSISSASLRTPDCDDVIDTTPVPKDSTVSRSSSNFWKRLTRRATSFRPPSTPEPHAPRHEDPYEEDNYGDPEPPPTQTTSCSAKDAFIRQTQLKLVPVPSYPPLLTPPNYSPPPFPSSSIPHKYSVARPTLAMTMFRSRLLQQLECGVSGFEEDLMSNSSPSRGNARSPPQYVDLSNPILEPYPPKETGLSAHSPGLRRWIQRPCFEDRFTTFIAHPDSEKPHECPVTASLAVASLEYSDYLDILATPSQTGNLSSDISSDSPPLTSSASPTTDLSTPTPLPLLGDQGSVESSSPLPSPPPETNSSEQPVPVRRGVRFAQEDERDDIPLGYAVRRRQKQAQKEKFLQEERERRAFQEEQRRIMQERHRREQEKLEWEKERRAWEQEKKATEEECRRRHYAAAFTAARQRQETSRSGGMNSPRHLTPSGSTSSLRDVAAQQARRQHSASPASQGSSPRDSGSRPGSIMIPPPIDNSHGHSRPSSLYSSSSDDSRARDGGSRRLPSAGHTRPASERSLSQNKTPQYPLLSQQTFIPPVPNMPNYLEMPLMPPTPPFVLQQYPRRPHSQSPTPSYRRSPSDTEQRPQSYSGRGGSSSPHRVGTGHQRTPSGDSRNSSSLGRNRERGRAQAGPYPPAQLQDSAFRPPPPRRSTAM